MKSVKVPEPKYHLERVLSKNNHHADAFVSKEKVNNPNAFVKMRNGIGRLMAHFSKSKLSKMQ